MTAPVIETRVRESFAKQRLMQTIGARVDVVRPGHVELSLVVRDDLTQQNGFLHAGVLAALADSACGYAALTTMPPGSDVLSIEFKVNMLAPAKGESIVARADVLRSGRTVVVCRADVYAKQSGDEKLVAAMQGTMAVRQ
jgi:uncharacterized protein (TIGR00369 family)